MCFLHICSECSAFRLKGVVLFPFWLKASKILVEVVSLEFSAAICERVNVLMKSRCRVRRFRNAAILPHGFHSAEQPQLHTDNKLNIDFKCVLRNLGYATSCIPALASSNSSKRQGERFYYHHLPGSSFL